MSSKAIDELINSGSALLGIAIDPAWREDVRLHLAMTLRLAAVVENFPLPDEAEPAPLFTA